MELKDFIKDVIVSIYNGISEAKETTGKHILPQGNSISESIPYISKGMAPLDPIAIVSNLEFELSLTEGDKNGITGGIGVLLGSLTMGSKGNNEHQQTSLSKIKFNIPIELA